MAVDAVFDGAIGEEVVDVDGLGLLDQAGDRTVQGRMWRVWAFFAG